MKCEKSCGAVVFTKINNEVRYVLVQQSEGFHGFPKGHMEDGETEEQTALREIFEEIGIRPQIVKGFRTVDEHMIPKKADTIKEIVYFLTEYTNQKIVVQKDELLDVKLLPYVEAYNTFEYESSKRILKEANDFLNMNFYERNESIIDDK